MSPRQAHRKTPGHEKSLYEKTREKAPRGAKGAGKRRQPVDSGHFVSRNCTEQSRGIRRGTRCLTRCGGGATGHRARCRARYPTRDALPGAPSAARCVAARGAHRRARRPSSGTERGRRRGGYRVRCRASSALPARDARPGAGASPSTGRVARCRACCRTRDALPDAGCIARRAVRRRVRCRARGARLAGRVARHDAGALPSAERVAGRSAFAYDGPKGDA